MKPLAQVPLADCFGPPLSSTFHVLSAAWNPRDLEETSCQFSVLSGPVTVQGELKSIGMNDPGAGSLRVLPRIVADAGTRTKAFLGLSSSPAVDTAVLSLCFTPGGPFPCQPYSQFPGTSPLGNKGG